AERLQWLGRQRAELAGVTLAHRLAELTQESLAGWRDADAHDATIIRRPVTRNQAALLQLIEQARDVRRPGQEPRGQVQRTNHARIFTVQQSQGVVLLWRKVVAAEQLLFEA